MPFNIYPDDPTAALLGKPSGAPIMLAASEAMRSFVPLADNVGPDPALGNAPTLFIRIAMSGAPAPQAQPPKFELLAHDPNRPDGSPAPPLDPNTAISIGTAVTLFDDDNPTGAALAYFSPPFLDNVYFLKVVLEIPDTRFWIRITNTTDADRKFVWVVADSEADTQQPWIHATYRGAVPAHIKFDAFVGQTSAQTAQPMAITNYGTGPFTVAGVTPAVAAPYTISGLPATLASNPSTPATLMVGFDAPSTPGDTPAAVFGFVTSNKTDPGPFGEGHNNQFILSAHTSLPPPSFAASPNQFSPKRGQPGAKVQLFGKNFDVGQVSVRFGTATAPIVPVSAAQIVASVPDLQPGSVKITVKTDAGSVTSDDDFKIPPLPVIDALDPDSGGPGDTFTVFGQNFIIDPGDFVVVSCALPTDPSSPPNPGPLTIVGSPTATQITVTVPNFTREIRFPITVSRSDGMEVTSDGDFQITLL